MPFRWPHSARRWLIQWWRLAGYPQNPHDHGTSTLVLRLHLCRADLRICPSWSGHVVLLISMSSGVCQASSSLVLGLLWMIVWLAFLIHCDLPELKYFQNGAHRRSSAFVLQVMGFSTFLQRILCRHWFRGRSYIIWVVSSGRYP